MHYIQKIKSAAEQLKKAEELPKAMELIGSTVKAYEDTADEFQIMLYMFQDVILAAAKKAKSDNEEFAKSVEKLKKVEELSNAMKLISSTVNVDNSMHSISAWEPLKARDR